MTAFFQASGSYDTASSVEDPLIVNLRAEFAERQARWRRRRQQAGNRVPGMSLIRDMTEDCMVHL